MPFSISFWTAYRLRIIRAHLCRWARVTIPIGSTAEHSTRPLNAIPSGIGFTKGTAYTGALLIELNSVGVTRSNPNLLWRCRLIPLSATQVQTTKNTTQWTPHNLLPFGSACLSCKDSARKRTLSPAIVKIWKMQLSASTTISMTFAISTKPTALCSTFLFPSFCSAH